jgi:hypothetical protein
VTMEGSLTTVITGVMGSRTTEPSVESAIFGSADPPAMAAAVDDFCRRELHASVEQGLFYASSQGTVFGLELDQGQRIVVKVHQPDRTAAFLFAVHDVQRHLLREGFPCPAPILGPSPLGRGLALVDQLMDDGNHEHAHEPAIRREMASALATLVRMARAFVSSPHLPSTPWLLLPTGSLWRTPHNRMFDFEATAAGAEWIDDIATEALERLKSPAGEMIVGHTDWSVKDFRFRNATITAIYDWDSLLIEREPVIVGQAATHFTMTWWLPVRVSPSFDEAQAFVSDYEAARGEIFSVSERRAVEAAGVYSMAYTARCEHALDPGGREFPPGSAREFLAALGECS